MNLKGRNIIISGASQGLGFEIAKLFLMKGANIAICARNPESLKNAQHQLEGHKTDEQYIFSYTVDVSDYLEFKNFIDLAVQKLGHVDALIANAGIYGPMGSIDEVEWKEWSDAIDVNLKGTVIQCKCIVPHFKNRKKGKIILLSGGGATKPMPNLSAYAAAKAGVVRFGETLSEELKSFGIDVNSVAPGALNTRLLDQVLEAGEEKVGPSFYNQFLKQKATGGDSLETGAELCLFLASEESNGITGKLISAKWDPWKILAHHKEQIKDSDVYTLRRIIPEDRSIVIKENV